MTHTGFILPWVFKHLKDENQATSAWYVKTLHQQWNWMQQVSEQQQSQLK